LSNDPRLNWNLAACERKAKHNANVLRLIELYLRDGEGWLSEEDKKEANRAAAAVRTFVASATVKTEPPDGVEIYVDDIRIGSTPVERPIWVDAGVHRVRFAKTGMTTVERTGGVGAGGGRGWSGGLERPEPKEFAPPPLAPPRVAAPSDVGLDSHVSAAPSRIGPLLLAGVGVVAAATGGAFVFFTTRRYSQLQEEGGTASPHS